MNLNLNTEQAALEAARIRISHLEAEVALLKASATKWKRVAFSDTRTAPACDTCGSALGHYLADADKTVVSWCSNTDCPVGKDTRNATSL